MGLVRFAKGLANIVILSWWDLSNKNTRFEMINTIANTIPGQAGFEIRRITWSHYVQGLGQNVAIHKGVRILNSDKIVIGDNVRIGFGNYIQAAGGIIIGEHTILGPFVKIWSANHKFDDPGKPIQDQGYEYKPVHIGRHVWIGADAFIMPGTHIGDRCIISAGSVVGAKRYPPNWILSGNPARKIGERPS